MTNLLRRRRRGSASDLRRSCVPGRVRALLVVTVLLTLPTALHAVAQEGGAAVLSATVSGQVLATSGEPVAGAEVVVEDTGSETTADAAGRFSLSLPAGTYSLRAGASGFTVTRQRVTLRAGAGVSLRFTLAPVDLPLDEVVVTSSFSLLTDEALAPLALNREEILAMPHFGDDLYRAIEVLPGVASGDFSAAFSVRGGLHSELLVRLDGHELFEPFHLKDFQGVFSSLDPQVVASVNLIPGAFPAEYGDRMGGVLDLIARRPVGASAGVGISFSNAWAYAASTFADGRGSWLTSLRRGYLDVVLNFVGDADADEEEPDPRYWDGFAKLDWAAGERQALSLLVHLADDSLRFFERDPGEVTNADTGYGSALVGLQHVAMVGEETVVETRLSADLVNRRRDIESVEDDEFAVIRDERDLTVLALRQDWSRTLGRTHYAKAGFEARTYEAVYDYRNDFARDDPVDDPRFLPAAGATAFDATLDGETYAVWLADRLRLGDGLTAELGGRWERWSEPSADRLSPRLNLVWEAAPRQVVRAGWGHFYQSQRPHELPVEYGDRSLAPVQRAVHWTLGWERSGERYSLRADAYRRTVDDPQRRYATLFDPVSPVPEVESDRIRIDAREVEATGLEVYLRRTGAGRFSWWASYAYSEIDDVVAGAAGGERRQPRSIDQTHALTWSASLRLGPRWQAHWVWTYHTGWPTTAIRGTVERGADRRFVVREEIGTFYAERLPDYHRLDLRLSRRTPLGRGHLTLFLDVQNVYDRDNARGIDVDETRFRVQPDGGVTVDYETVEWLGILPSFGVSWEF